MIRTENAKPRPWNTFPRPLVTMVRGLLADWVESAIIVHGLHRCAAAVLSFIASELTGSWWTEFRMCIRFIMRGVGYSRASVFRALEELKARNLIKRDGQVHVGRERPVVVYRLSGTPECPLPEVVERGRWEAWEDSQAIPPEWEDPSLVSAGQGRNETKTKTEETRRTTDGLLSPDQGDSSFPPGDIDQPPAAGKGVGVNRRSRLKEVVKGGFSRWVPHLGLAPSWVAPPAGDAVERGAGSVADGLGGPVGCPTLSGVLGGAQAARPGVTGRSGNAVSYRPPPTRGAAVTPFTDPALGRVSRDTRLFYLGLRQLADTDGHVLADPAYLKAQIFPYDAHLGGYTNEEAILAMITALEDARKLVRIPDYLRLTDIEPVSDALFDPPSFDLVPAKHRTVSVRMVKASEDPWFVKFWDVYPRRTGRGAARKAFAKAVANGTSPAVIVECAAAYADRCRLIQKEIQFIPHPSVWLNQERWDDDPEQAPQVRSKVDDAMRAGMDLVRFYEEQERLERGEDGRPKEIGW